MILRSLKLVWSGLVWSGLVWFDWVRPYIPRFASACQAIAEQQELLKASNELVKKQRACLIKLQTIKMVLHDRL